MANQGRIELSSNVAKSVTSYLDSLQVSLEGMQLASGGLPHDWHEQLKSHKASQVAISNVDLISPQLLSTSHHLEWILLRNRYSAIDRKFFMNSSQFLFHGAKSLIRSHDRGLTETSDYCCLSHAVHVLYLLNSTHEFRKSGSN